MKNYKAILIVEDDEILAQILGNGFIKRDYQVKIVHNTKEAILSLNNFHPRYAVIDLKMPGESGLECIKAIHQFDQSVKIVMLTGYASITTTIKAIKYGACYYLAKPANIDDIILAFSDETKNFELKSDITIAKKSSIKNLEWEYIHQALTEANFNISKAARILGMHRRTLARKLEKRPIK